MEIHFTGTMAEFQELFGLNLKPSLSASIPVDDPHARIDGAEIPKPGSGLMIRKYTKTKTIKQTAYEIVLTFMREKADISTILFQDALAQVGVRYSKTQTAGLLGRVMKDPLLSRYYEKVKTGPSRLSPVLYRHTGIEYCPPEVPTKPLAAIPPKSVAARPVTKRSTPLPPSPPFYDEVETEW